MLEQTKHRVNLINILKDIYSNPELRPILGFKGGTAAMLFYDLPRLSVDLDFDLLDADKKKTVFEKMKSLLKKHGVLRQAIEKRYTLFFLISYEKEKHTIKVEISKRKGASSFEPRSYLGIIVLVMKLEDMIAGKLSALLTRRKFAMRDVFDMWFFLKNNWSINEAVLIENTGYSLSKALELAAERVRRIDKRQILYGLGELLNERQKVWVRDNLINETVFYLRDYRYRYLPVSENIPILDIDPGVGGESGSHGHFVHFQAINIGESVAIDVRWGIRGFAYEWRSPDIFALLPGNKKKLEYKISDEQLFKKFIPELNIFFEYKDNKGVNYFTRRELVLERAVSGAFNIIKKVGAFHPAVVLQDSKIRNISEPYHKGIRTEVEVEVEVDNKIKQIHIGIAALLEKIFGFSKYELKAAFAELVQRKVRNMLHRGSLEDYVFTGKDLPKKQLSGFEAYKALRNSLDTQAGG